VNKTTSDLEQNGTVSSK